MFLTKDQYQGQSKSDDFFEGDFILPTDAYWDKIWNATISKYMIPFIPHPSKEAQESKYLR